MWRLGRLISCNYVYFNHKCARGVWYCSLLTDTDGLSLRDFANLYGRSIGLSMAAAGCGHSSCCGGGGGGGRVGAGSEVWLMEREGGRGGWGKVMIECAQCARGVWYCSL